MLWVVFRGLPKTDQRNQRVDVSGLRAVGVSAVVGDAELETATLAAGCFWCVEAVLERIKGVVSVESGYTGGETPNPTYGQISGGRTGHAEAVQIRFDPTLLSYEQLLMVFWELHDPTTKNRQGADRGTQYRSVIFYHDDKQREVAEASLAAKDASDHLKRGIVTEIVPLTTFYVAEEYHQDFSLRNPTNPYIRRWDAPKVEALREEFPQLYRSTFRTG